MQYNKVEISGVNTNELKTLKESEKLELLKKAHSGDKKAREELIKQCRRKNSSYVKTRKSLLLSR